MITAQDIREKCFEKARIGGYAMDEVDDFLDELANDAAASQKEIATLNAKMKYLADKIREYQGSEEAMNMALVSAQKLAKNIEEDARAKAEALVASAQKEADDILASAKAESDRTIGAIEANRKAEELRYEKARAAAAEYIQKVRMLLDREQTFLTTLAEADLTGAVVTPAPAEKKAIAAPALRRKSSPPPSRRPNPKPSRKRRRSLPSTRTPRTSRTTSRRLKTLSIRSPRIPTRTPRRSNSDF